MRNRLGLGFERHTPVRQQLSTRRLIAKSVGALLFVDCIAVVSPARGANPPAAPTTIVREDDSSMHAGAKPKKKSHERSGTRGTKHKAQARQTARDAANDRSAAEMVFGPGGEGTEETATDVVALTPRTEKPTLRTNGPAQAILAARTGLYWVSSLRVADVARDEAERTADDWREAPRTGGLSAVTTIGSKTTGSAVSQALRLTYSLGERAFLTAAEAAARVTNSKDGSVTNVLANPTLGLNYIFFTAEAPLLGNVALGTVASSSVPVGGGTSKSIDGDATAASLAGVDIDYVSVSGGFSANTYADRVITSLRSSVSQGFRVRGQSDPTKTSLLNALGMEVRTVSSLSVTGTVAQTLALGNPSSLKSTGAGPLGVTAGGGLRGATLLGETPVGLGATYLRGVVGAPQKQAYQAAQIELASAF